MDGLSYFTEKIVRDPLQFYCYIFKEVLRKWGNTFVSNSLRLDQIYSLLLKKGSVTVEELSDSFHVTPTTIRRDLLVLEERKLIYRSRGSASLRDAADTSKDILRAEKIRIAKKAAQFVEPDMALSLDSGSTNRFLAEELLCDERFRYEELNIVTYSLRTALTTSQKFNVSIPGGAVFTAQDAMLGLEVENFYKKINVDVAFVGSTGVRDCSGPTVSYPVQLPVKQAAASCGARRIVLLDSQKFIRRGVYVICEWQNIDTLVTIQTPENEEQLEKIAKCGTHIVLA